MEDWHSNVYRKKESKRIENWKRIRERIIERDGKCFRCETRQRRKLTVHHIVPREEGGGNYEENLITLCSSCHDIVKLAECRSKIGILATLENQEAEEETEEVFKDREESFDRPEWHKWVYGGQRRRI